MLKHYFRLENLKAQAASMLANESLDGADWMIGHRFTDGTTLTLYPQLLDLVDSINSAQDEETKVLYAVTAARVIALSMVGIVQLGIEEHQELLVDHAQTAQHEASSIIMKVAGRF
jgi:hypothetical protein